MRNETRMEETKPVAPGVDFRLRLLRRLADPNRNAFWIFLVISGLSAIISVISLYVAIVAIPSQRWQLFIMVGIAAVLTVLSALTSFFSRQGRPGITIPLTLFTLQLGLIIRTLFISGLGLWFALGAIMATLSITTLCLPRDTEEKSRTAQTIGSSRIATLLNMFGVITALAVLGIDSYVPGLQLEFPLVIRIMVISGVSLISFLFMGTLILFFPSYSLRGKIAITVFSATILSLGLLFTLNNITTRQALLEAVNQTLMLAGRETARDIDAYFQEFQERLENQAVTPSLTLYLNLPPEQREPISTTRTYLLTQRTLYGARYYALLDIQGTVVLHTQQMDTTGFPSYLGLTEEVRSALIQNTSSGAVYISPVMFPSGSEEPFFVVAARIRDAIGVRIGTLVAAFPLDGLQTIVTAGKNTAGSGSYAILIDENNLQLVHGRNDESNYVLISLPDEDKYTALVAALRLPDLPYPVGQTYDHNLNEGLQLINQQPFFTAREPATATNLSSVAAIRLATRPWVLAFLQSQPTILAPVVEQTRLTLLLTVVVAGFAVLVSTLLARIVANPIIRLTSIAERAAAGNLNLQASAGSTDEIGTLSLAFNSMINQLRQTLQGLEKRVTERTTELAQASEQMQYRAERLQTVAELAHSIASVQDPAELLPRITQEISSRFGYYHVGIFLLDANKTYAVLEAANSKGGQRMLARSHRLRVGEVGIVGYVAGIGQPRIALDVGQDAVFFDNPDLPETRSEISLPLNVGPQIIGVLDVQSVEAGAFSQDDIALLSTLSDQVAMAIQNTRLYADSRRTVRELQLAQRQYLQEMWSKTIVERPTTGYEYAYGRLRPLQDIAEHHAEPDVLSPLDAEVFPGDMTEDAAAEPDALSSAANQSGKLVIPIGLRGQQIGEIDLQAMDPGRAWTTEELELVRSVADQIGLALENARLLEETQRRAEREHMVTNITTRLRASNDPKVIMETALAELRQALKVKSVLVRRTPNPARHDDADPPASESSESLPEDRGEV